MNKKLIDNINLYCWLIKKAGDKVVKVVENDGTIEYHLGHSNGVFHREDGPAVIKSNGDKFWYDKGDVSREDGPAIELNDGTKEWWFEGMRHRADGPAIERPNGGEEWWLNGKRHRIGGPAISGGPSGEKRWYVDGVIHREDGPAAEYGDGSKYWYFDGHLHNEHGPAIIKNDGTEEYYINDRIKEKEVTKTLPLIVGRYPDNSIKYQNFKTIIDWTDTVLHTVDDPSPIWVFDLETLEPIRQPKLTETIFRKVPVARLKDIEGGDI